MGAVISLSAACAAEGGAPEDESAAVLGAPVTSSTRDEGAGPLSLQVASEQELSGRFLSESNTELRFAVREVSSTAYRLDVFVNEAHLVVEADTAANSLYSQGHGAILSAVEREALGAASEALRRELGDEQGMLGGFAEHLLVQNLGFWAEAPEGYALGERTFDPSQKSLGNNGVTCVTKGKSYTASYDNGASGTTYSKSVVVNSNWGTNACGGGDYNCMGRCGAACDKWYAASSYTLDCLEHDLCSHDKCASGGRSDSNCGDEFKEAQDDWTFGMSNGCSG